VQALPREDRLDFESLRRGRIHRYQGSLHVAAGAHGVVLELLPDCSIAAAWSTPRARRCRGSRSASHRSPPALEIERPLRWEAFENLKGEFEVDGTLRGTWSLLARTPEGSLSVPQSLVLAADVEGEELVVPAATRCSVHTLDASGQPVAGAHVVVQNSTPELERFELDQLDTHERRCRAGPGSPMLNDARHPERDAMQRGDLRAAVYELRSLDEPTEIRLVLQRGAIVKPATW
jgi:hypothetical protein